MRQIRNLAFLGFAAVWLVSVRPAVVVYAYPLDCFDTRGDHEDFPPGSWCDSDGWEAYDDQGGDACDETCDADLGDTCRDFCGGPPVDQQCHSDGEEDLGNGVSVCHGFYIECQCLAYPIGH